MDAVDDAAFEAAVRDGLDAVPPELMAMADNVAIFVEDEPSAEHADPTLSDEDNAELLGIYLGTPLTERDGWWAAGSMPDRVVLFRGPLTRMCADLDELRDEVAITVVHEIAHHFGIDDARLHALGWG
ncbi:metallopeptidase family protein [Janibacter sp. YIM B02568]|uniref:metallopeptidase family protein n=1 Tax=Janibacter endophyticus TaxID=2806261 RepID=UPI00194DD944|nr:metallopeptidase family protein [Janibacter endophyticus]MBM6546191.1 metallopeptidase family protein [Janibacter endophyticus]